MIDRLSERLDQIKTDTHKVSWQQEQSEYDFNRFINGPFQDMCQYWQGNKKMQAFLRDYEASAKLHQRDMQDSFEQGLEQLKKEKSHIEQDIDEKRRKANKGENQGKVSEHGTPHSTTTPSVFANRDDWYDLRPQ
jgi:hypothetical protein